MPERWRRWLGSPRATWLVLAVALALSAPSLTTGLVADDLVQQLLLHQPRALSGMSSHPLDLFCFATGEPAEYQAMVDVGAFPWWTNLHVRLRFLRPVSSLTHALDYALWPSSAIAMHAHSLVWLGLAFVAAAFFYRRFLPERWLAALAFLLYAVDDAHGPTLGWVANRNALVALALALPAVAVHDRWRKDGWRPGAWLAPLLLGVGLLAGESALATGAYLVAHALWLDEGRLLGRVLRLWRYGLVVILWRAVYVALHYGATGSGIYLDPVRDPLHFASHFVSRFFLLALGQLAFPWSDFGTLYQYVGPRLELKIVLLGVVVTGAFALLVVPLWRASATARFFATGTLLSLIPICSTFPADRLLWFVGLGAMGLVAQLLATPGPRILRTVTVAILVLLHLVMAPLLLPIRARSMVTIDNALRMVNESIPQTPDIADKTLILVNPAGDAFAGYVTLMRAALGQQRPARLRWLTAGTSSVRVRRLDERTLLVRPQAGFLDKDADRLFRNVRRDPLPPGTRVRITGLTIEVTETLPDGRPAAATFTFDVSLDDPSLIWLAWRPVGGFAPFKVPAVGKEVELPPIDFFALMGDAAKGHARP